MTDAASEQEAPKLLPCPFCGKQPDLISVEEDSDPFRARCGTLGCPVDIRMVRPEVWNARADLAARAPEASSTITLPPPVEGQTHWDIFTPQGTLIERILIRQPEASEQRELAERIVSRLERFIDPYERIRGVGLKQELADIIMEELNRK